MASNLLENTADVKKVNSIVLNALKVAECNGCVYTLQLNGFPLWWFIRFRVHEALVKQLLNSNHENRKTRRVSRSAEQLITTIRRMSNGYYKMRRNNTSKPILLFCGSNGYGNHNKINGAPNGHRLFGDIYNKLPTDKRVLIEKPTDGTSDKYTLIHNYDAVFWDWALALSILKQGITSLPKAKGLIQFGNAINVLENFPVDKQLFKTIVINAIKANANKIAIQLRAAKIIFDTFQPGLILETASYDSASVAMNSIARLYNVPIIEMQHGILYKGHPGYSFYAPPKSDIIKPIPDKTLVYGEWFKETLIVTSSQYNNENVEVTGSPRLSNYTIGNMHYKTSTKNAIKARLRIGQESRLVTITTQPIISHKIAKYLDSVMQLLPSEYYICIKTHPGEKDYLKSIYGRISEYTRVRVATDETCDLYDLLITSDIHASVCSTVIFEAMALGIPNIIINMDNPLNITTMMNTTEYQVVKTPKELVDSIITITHDEKLRELILTTGYKDAQKYFYTKIDTAEIVVNKALELANK